MHENAREAVVAEAMMWLGTPFHHAARVKGAGVDCVQLLIAAFHDAGVLPAPAVEKYSADWFMHSNTPRYLDALSGFCVPLARDAKILPGDIATFRYGRSVSHAGLVIGTDPDVVIIHAYRGLGVTLDRLEEFHAMTARLAGYWRFEPWAEASR